METTNISIRQRPLRVGFLVRPGELADLRKAAGICSLLWGGIRNPIVSIDSETDQTARGFLDLFQIDVLCPVEHSAAIDGFVKRYPFLQSPRLHCKEVFYEDWRTKKNRITYLDAINIVDKYWEREFKHAPSEKRSNCTHITWDEADDLKDVFSLSYGYYPADYNLEEDFRTAFLTRLRAREIHIDPATPLPVELAMTITPLRLTGAELTGYDWSHRDWTGVFFGNPRDFSDLVCFWNLRAAGNEIEFASLSHLDRFQNIIRAHLKRIDDLPQRHPTIPDDIVISCRGNLNEISEILTQFPTGKQKALSVCTDMTWNGYNVRPVTFCLDQQYALALIEQRREGYSVTVTLPEKKFLVDIDRHRGIEDQCLAVSLSPLGDFGHPGHTLAPPFRTELNEFYSREIGFDPWAIRSERNGLGVLIAQSDKSIRLHPIAHKAVIESLFRVAGLQSKVSQAGRLADRLLDKLDGIEGARVFKIRGVRELIGSLDSQAAIGRGQATDRIWNGGEFARHESLFIEPRDTPKLTTSAVFDFLLRNEFFRAGLELPCDACRLESWLPLRQIDDLWVCEFCGQRNLTSLHLRSRGDWKYRKSGLFAKDNNQEGAIPVLLGTLVLKRVLEHYQFMHVTSLELKDTEGSCELDFVVVRRHQEEIEWALGEAKDKGGRIDATDIQNMKRIAGKLVAIGVTPYLTFVKTADSFLPQEIELFRALQREGILPILITNKEIEPYHPYWEDDNEQKLPHKYANSMHEMALNSEYRYLQ